MIANEHYVKTIFSVRIQLSFLKWLIEGKKPFWTTTNPRHYDPYDFEHWRTKSELDSIFNKYNSIANYNLSRFDLCDDKPLCECLIMWITMPPWIIWIIRWCSFTCRGHKQYLLMSTTIYTDLVVWIKRRSDVTKSWQSLKQAFMKW